MDTDAIAEYVTHVPPTLLVLSEKRKNGGHKATYKTPMWEEYNNTDTLFPWKFAEDIIYLTKNSPQDDDLVLSIIDKQYSNEYDNYEETQVENNEYS